MRVSKSVLRYKLGSRTLADRGEDLGKVNERNNDRTGRHQESIGDSLVQIRQEP